MVAVLIVVTDHFQAIRAPTVAFLTLRFIVVVLSMRRPGLVVFVLCILILWPLSGGRMRLPAALGQLGQSRGIASSYWAQRGVRECDTSPQTAAHQSTWGRPIAPSCFRRRGV